MMRVRFRTIAVVEALVGTVVELGDLLGLPLPHLRTVYATTKLLDQTLRQARAAPWRAE